MLEALIGTLQAFPRGLVFVALGLVVLVAAKLVRDLVTHYNVEQEISEKQNLAVALRLSGYFIGVILIFLGALYQPLTLVGVEGLGFDLEYGIQVIRVLVYSLAGIVALNLVRLLMNRLVLYKFNIEEEIVRGQNVGTGAAEFGMYIAVGLVVAGAVSGEGTGSELEAALTALAFFAMGTALLVVFALFYELTTHFDIHDEIEGNNAAVGVAFGGNLIAIGLVTLKAVFGEFTGWGESIVAFLIYGVIGFVLLYVMRLLIDLLILRTVKVSDALAVDRNLGVALVESAVVISSAMVLFVAI
jgi:uncharacterized membrane protein YjfL (UPF0719 family)